MIKPMHALITAVALLCVLATVTYVATRGDPEFSRSCTSRVEALYSRCTPTE